MWIARHMNIIGAYIEEESGIFMLFYVADSFGGKGIGDILILP